MEKIIEELREIVPLEAAEQGKDETLSYRAVRRLEECHALLERLATDGPAPEGHTFQSWARELLA